MCKPKDFVTPDPEIIILPDGDQIVNLNDSILLKVYVIGTTNRNIILSFSNENINIVSSTRNSMGVYKFNLLVADDVDNVCDLLFESLEDPYISKTIKYTINE